MDKEMFSKASKKADIEDDSVLIVDFVIGKERYGIDISSVQEVIIKPEVTGVPRSISFLDGVVNLRGKIIPVLDLRQRFGMSPIEVTMETRIIIVNCEGQQVGLTVDQVYEVIKINKNQIDFSKNLVTNINTRFVYGVINVNDQIITMLDLSNVIGITPEEKKKHEKKLVEIGRKNYLEFINRSMEA